MKKAIVFDWDDVITLGSKEGYYRCYEKTLEELGVELKPEVRHERIQKNWGKPFRAELEGLLFENPDLLDNAVEIMENNFWGETFVSELTILEGCQDLLRSLSKTYQLAVVTGNHPKMLNEVIYPKFNIPNVFSKVITAFDLSDPSLSKPHPFMLNQVLQELSLNPEEAVYVGDAKNDVLMAQAADVEPVVVLTGHLSQPQAEELQVKHIIPSVMELEKVLNKI